LFAAASAVVFVGREKKRSLRRPGWIAVCVVSLSFASTRKVVCVCLVCGSTSSEVWVYVLVLGDYVVIVVRKEDPDPARDVSYTRCMLRRLVYGCLRRGRKNYKIQKKTQARIRGSEGAL
jgi:hypothetical protein